MQKQFRFKDTVIILLCNQNKKSQKYLCRLMLRVLSSHNSHESFVEP
jgi:hypothetical protein